MTAVLGLFIAWSSQARADYFVTPTSACTLTFAIDSVRQGGDRHGCVSSGSFSNFIGLEAPSGAATYTLAATQTITFALFIYNDSVNSITVQSSATGGVFEVKNTGDLTFDGLIIRHSSGNGRVILNRGELMVEYSTVTNGGTAFGSNTTLDGGGIWNQGHVTLWGATVRNNKGRNGGGVYNDVTGPGSPGNGMDISYSTLNNNTATSKGGAIRTRTRVLMVNSTISTNTATVNGGGISADDTSGLTYLEMTYCTLAFNSSVTGGGVYMGNTSATQTRSSIISMNSATTAPNYYGNPNGEGFYDGTIAIGNLYGNISGITIALGDSNFYPVDPLLGTLQNNGGYAFTHAIPSNSPFRTWAQCYSQANDERFYGRPSAGPGEGCDFGAYQYQ